MRNLADTIARLSKLNGHAGEPKRSGGAADRLTDLTGFGSNPGALRARTYVPESLAEGAALVVVLHGCTQTAAGYDIGTGWSDMADRHGFALLFAEQQQANNPNLCFNWFSPEDARRGGGEALSIRQMIESVVAEHSIDPARIYVTGLSAGGAMAAVMLATYPELFAGGAIMAGLPYGCATTIPQAFDRMRGHGLPDAAALTALVRNASSHAGPWPTLSIWQGTADATVHPDNAEAIFAQWRALHEVGVEPTRREMVDGQPRRVWCDAAGRAVIESYTIAGMGHGTPVATTGADACGRGGPYMLDVGISSTQHLCRSWNLTGEREMSDAEPTSMEPPARTLVPAGGTIAMSPNLTRQPTRRPATPPHAPAKGVGAVIENALRAAGLMR